MKSKILSISILALILCLISCDDNSISTDPPNMTISQVWTTKNLDVDHYRNGDKIPQVTDPTEWENLTTGAWCYFNNDPLMGQIYGKLYNGYAVKDSRGLAPKGWHVPNVDEWNTFIAYAGGMEYAGGKLKEKGSLHWQYPNVEATDKYSFAALPGGVRRYDGTFANVNKCCCMWTSTEQEVYGTLRLMCTLMYSDSSKIFIDIPNLGYGMSVRCVKD